MPEIITKHPGIILKILKDANIKCGISDQPKILTTCPKERFCLMPTGEMCVYGIKDIPKMTQINELDILSSPGMIFPFIALCLLIFLGGMLIGVWINKILS